MALPDEKLAYARSRSKGQVCPIHSSICFGGIVGVALWVILSEVKRGAPALLLAPRNRTLPGRPGDPPARIGFRLLPRMAIAISAIGR